MSVTRKSCPEASSARTDHLFIRTSLNFKNKRKKDFTYIVNKVTKHKANKTCFSKQFSVNDRKRKIKILERKNRDLSSIKECITIREKKEGFRRSYTRKFSESTVALLEQTKKIKKQGNGMSEKTVLLIVKRV